MQSHTNDEMFIILEQYHQTLKNKNLKAAPDKSQFLITRVKFLGYIIEKKHYNSIKITDGRNSKTSATHKLKNSKNSLEC